jgi:hypothetical protein
VAKVYDPAELGEVPPVEKTRIPHFRPVKMIVSMPFDETPLASKHCWATLDATSITLREPASTILADADVSFQRQENVAYALHVIQEW